MKTTTAIIGLLLLFVVPLASADVVVFDRYDTTMEYRQGQLFVTKELRLKNVGPTPIIPGEIHFKIAQEGKKGSFAPAIESFSVVNKYGTTLETRQHASDSEVDLVFTVWDPLLPEFFYEMTMTYSIGFEPRGILFYQVVLPEERTTIPISAATTTFELPKRYHITYLSPEGDVGAGEEVKAVSWNVKDSYTVEYSVVPFPRLGFKAVNIFWVLIIILFMLNLFFRLRKKARAARSL